MLFDREKERGKPIDMKLSRLETFQQKASAFALV